jgi:fatty acid desaturase
MSAVSVPQFTRTTPLPNRTEWPTVAVAGCIAAGLVAVASFHHRLPVIVTLAILAVLGAWYGSLQHEVIHGHPTPSRLVNIGLAGAPLTLFVPFWVYRATHLGHHIDENLTDPLLDPESYYVGPDTWHQTNALHRRLLQARRTVLGRLLLGPVVTAYGVARYLWRDNSLIGRARMVRAIGGVVVVLLTVRAAGVPVWLYVVGFGYLGQSLSPGRSYGRSRRDRNEQYVLAAVVSQQQLPPHAPPVSRRVVVLHPRPAQVANVRCRRRGWRRALSWVR